MPWAVTPTRRPTRTGSPPIATAPAPWPPSPRERGRSQLPSVIGRRHPVSGTSKRFAQKNMRWARTRSVARRAIAYRTI
jgi:hypothetical protein